MCALIAVDVGCTTVVAAAGGDDGEPRLLQFEGEDGALGAMTASLVLRSDGSARVGGEADRELDVDPHRGVRGPLAHLESGSAVLELAGGPVPVVALVGELLARPLRVLARGTDDAPERAVLTIPSSWPPEGRRARALTAAAALAGLPPVTLVPAAVAAAAMAAAAQAETVLVCDVGGRATQLSLVDVDAELIAPRLLATTELGVGTDLFDETLYLEVLRLLEDEDPDAAQRLEEQHLLTAVADAAPDTALWAACQAELARAVRRCREGLAQADRYRLELPAPVRLTLEVERDRLTTLLESELGLVAAAAGAQTAQARATAPPADRPPEPARAVLVGGGASTPGLRAALAAELGLSVTIPGDPLTAVARGALLAAAPAAPAPAPARPAGQVRRAARRPGNAGAPAMRTVLDDVVAAVAGGEEVVAVVRHDRHQRVVRVDDRGRVGAAEGIGGSDVLALCATPAAVVVATVAEASLLAPDLRRLIGVPRPLMAAADGASAWVAHAGDEQAPVLRLTTLAVAGRAAQAVAEERLGVAAAPSRGGLRPGARGARPAPPRAHCSVRAGRLLFAIPARGRVTRPAQLLGEAGAAGLAELEAKADGPPWVTARAASPGGAIVTLTGGGGAAAWRLALGPVEAASWPAGVRVTLVGAPDGGGPWIVAARQARWEALRLAGEDLVLVCAGDGAVEVACAGEDGLWLVCESAGERRLVCVGADGALERLAAADARLEPVGRAGGELLALVGPRSAPRRLVALG